MDSADVAAEVLAARGLAAVLDGNASLGGALLNEADAKTGEIGDAALAARVLCYRARAADIAGNVGRREWERVRDTVERAGGADQVGAGLAALSEIALLNADSQAESVRNVVRLVAAALAADDLEVWWALPGLAEAMARHPAPPEGADAAVWSQVLLAAKARIPQPTHAEHTPVWNRCESALIVSD